VTEWPCAERVLNKFALLSSPGVFAHELVSLDAREKGGEKETKLCGNVGGSTCEFHAIVDV
jgi:hypothetical protein